MYADTLAKVNRFGRIGKLAVTVLLVLSVLFTLALAAGAVYTASLPKDALRAAVTRHIALNVNEENFPALWGLLSDGFSYASAENPAELFQDGGGSLLPPEDTEIDMEFAFFNDSYASASIRSQGDEKVIEAVSPPAEYRSSDLSALLVSAALFAASVTAALMMLRRLFGVLSRCVSPFCTEFVSKLRAFGYSLLPVAVFATVGETLSLRFLSAGRETDLALPWEILVTFAVTMCLVTVFRYGVQLQKESDETL